MDVIDGTISVLKKVDQVIGKFNSHSATTSDSKGFENATSKLEFT
jgi:hypothetical protein